MFAPHYGRDPWAYTYELPLRIFDQNFGGGLIDDQLLPAILGGPSNYAVAQHHRPRRLHSQRESGISEVESTKDKFVVRVIEYIKGFSDLNSF
jgi:hypothetical protein